MAHFFNSLLAGQQQMLKDHRTFLAQLAAGGAEGSAAGVTRGGRRGKRGGEMGGRGAAGGGWGRARKASGLTGAGSRCRLAKLTLRGSAVGDRACACGDAGAGSRVQLEN